MAAIFQTRSAVNGHLIGHRVYNLFAGIVGAVATWNDTRVTRNALNRLSDHELDDLGLNRGDIENLQGWNARV